MTEIEEILVGKNVVTFYPNSHIYKLNGVRIPSVTTIIGKCIDKPGLIIWALNLARDYLLALEPNLRNDSNIHEAVRQHTIKKEQAGDVGTMVHDFAERYLSEGDKGLKDITDDQAIKGIGAFADWYNSHEIKVVDTERIVYGEEGYVGRFDAILEIDGKKTLVDFKTSKYFYEMECRLQTSAYMHAYCQETGEEPFDRMILHFSKETGDFEAHTFTVDEFPDDVKNFLSCLQFYFYQKKYDKKS